MADPYLSVVVASRNDDYTGDMLRRTQVFISSWLEQADRYGLRSELILVDWNPPPDRPPLRGALSWPVRAENCTVRVIEVPPTIHYQFPFANKLAFFTSRARNVGIRRARGEFVLPTMTDILFSDELVQFLASKQLHSDGMYRVDRYDVPADVLQLSSVDARLAYCKQNVLQIR